MEEELFALINRTELEAGRAEALGFHETAQALKFIASSLRNPSQGASPLSQPMQFSH